MSSLFLVKFSGFMPQVKKTDVRLSGTSNFSAIQASDQFERDVRPSVTFGTHPTHVDNFRPGNVTTVLLQESYYPRIYSNQYQTVIQLPPNAPPPVQGWFERPQELLKEKPNPNGLTPTWKSVNTFKKAQFAWDESITRTLYNFAYLMNVDALTGLWNRSFYNSELCRRLKIADFSWRPPVSVAFVDLNDFKCINEVFGHEVGDIAINAFGRVIKDVQLPKDTYACRTGGDEFAILFPNGTSPKVANEVFEKIEKKLQRSPVSAGKNNVYLSCSFAFKTHESSEPDTPRPRTTREINTLTDMELRHVKDLKGYSEVNPKTGRAYRDDFAPLSEAVNAFLKADISTDDGRTKRRESHEDVLEILSKPRPSLTNYGMPELPTEQQ